MINDQRLMMNELSDFSYQLAGRILYNREAIFNFVQAKA